jgi:hypothetical protein
MHTAQIILIEIEDGDDDEPQAMTERFLDSAMESGGTWFDWYGGGVFGTTLAGRWSGQVVEGDVLRYSDNPELAEKIIRDFLDIRQREIEYSQKVIDGRDINGIEFDPSNHAKDEMLGYALYKMGKILTNFWCPESGVYDSVVWSPDLHSFRERVVECPENQYLVVVDFHF